MTSSTLRTTALALALLGMGSSLLACRSGGDGVGPRAKAAIEPRSGSGLSGVARFTEVDGGVRVVVEISGVAPGLHGVHLHEIGDCSAPDGTSAGGHFNPDGRMHGGPDALEHHPGDFGNLLAGDTGTGRIELVTSALTVRPGRYSVVGRAIVVHEVEDDLISQPTGAAGGRIGCGVVTLEP